MSHYSDYTNIIVYLVTINKKFNIRFLYPWKKKDLYFLNNEII